VIPALVVDFDYLISKHKLEDGDKFEDHINKDSRTESSAIVDPCLRTVAKGTIIQLERIGFFRVDEAYSAANNKPIVLFKIPDGKQKCCTNLK
jgi:glutamyl-tRNA synthetase